MLLGTAFLGELARHFRGHLPLMLVAYNAGPGAARKFYRRLKDFPTDIFVEAVPYSATVAYVKKVIGLAAGYRAMYDEGERGPILVPSALPETLGPFLERKKPEPRAQAKGPRIAGSL